MRATVLLVLLFAPSAAHAQLGLPPLMVAYRDRQHGTLSTELAPLATSWASWDGAAYEGTIGGGLRAAITRRGGWPDYHSSSEWAAELRVRVMATHVPSGGPDIEVPIDVLLRWGALSYRSYMDTNGWPTQVYEAEPFVPYVGIGITLDVSTQHGVARVGPVIVGGLHAWVADRFGFFGEIEIRAIFADARPIGRLGGSLGILVGL
jgi:hypothetical protein